MTIALASFRVEYISPQLDFEVIHVTVLVQWGISRYDGSRGLNMLEWLGLFCAFIIIMSRPSSRYLLFLQPGSQNELCGAGLSLTVRSEGQPDPQFEVQLPSQTWHESANSQQICKWVNEINKCCFKPFHFEMICYMALAIDMVLISGT